MVLNIFARASISRVTEPIGAWLGRHGWSPNVVTVVGAAASSASALWFYPRGQLFVGTVAVTFFLLFDLLDGAMARTRGRTTPFGAVLDASCDRITDGIVFGALAWWAMVVAGDRLLGAVLLVCLAAAQVISYVKAKAEAVGLEADGGLAERAERLIIVLVGTGLTGLGLWWALPAAGWLLAVLCVITIGQRLIAVHRSSESRR